MSFPQPIMEVNGQPVQETNSQSVAVFSNGNAYERTPPPSACSVFGGRTRVAERIMAALRRQPETQELVGAPLYSSQDPIIFITRIPRHKLAHLLSNNGLALERVLSMVDFDTQRKYW